MKLNQKILSILTILAIIGMLCVSSTVTAASDAKYLDDSHDGHDGAIIPPDINHNEAKMLNKTNTDVNATNSTQLKVGNQNLNNTTTNSTNATNTTHAAGGDANATAPHKLPATGNPIVMLLMVSLATVGVYSIRKRN